MGAELCALFLLGELCGALDPPRTMLQSVARGATVNVFCFESVFVRAVSGSCSCEYGLGRAFASLACTDVVFLFFNGDIGWQMHMMQYKLSIRKNITRSIEPAHTALEGTCREGRARKSSFREVGANIDF